MTISNLPPSGPKPPSPGIEDFRRSAALGTEVRVQIDGESLKLIATGQTPSARSVAWVDASDVTGMFLDALASSFGGRLSQAVARELGLEPAPGKPLSSRKVEQALEIAATANTALEGIDFAARLEQTLGRGLPPGNRREPE